MPSHSSICKPVLLWVQHAQTFNATPNTYTHHILAGKKRSSAKAAPRSRASPGQSTGSGPAGKGRGTKQAGRRRSRESEEEGLSEKSEGESLEDESSAKRSVSADALLHQPVHMCLFPPRLKMSLFTHLTCMHCCVDNKAVAML